MLYLHLFWEFFKTGLFAVGGGLATLPFLQDMADRTGWFTRAQLADMLAVSESTPGPIGVNMATYVGFSTGGVGGALIAMCIEGQEMSSVALSQKMQQLAARGASQLTFLIGSSFGLDEDLKKKADLRLSMSPMTFPHHLARVMLLEQIYRAYQIEAGTKYHK